MAVPQYRFPEATMATVLHGCLSPGCNTSVVPLEGTYPGTRLPRRANHFVLSEGRLAYVKVQPQKYLSSGFRKYMII